MPVEDGYAKWMMMLSWTSGCEFVLETAMSELMLIWPGMMMTDEPRKFGASLSSQLRQDTTYVLATHGTCLAWTLPSSATSTSTNSTRLIQAKTFESNATQTKIADCNSKISSLLDSLALRVKVQPKK
jgi:hypothetical protein